MRYRQLLDQDTQQMVEMQQNKGNLGHSFSGWRTKAAFFSSEAVDPGRVRSHVHVNIHI